MATAENDTPIVTGETLARLFNLTPRRIQQLANDKVVVRSGRGKYDLVKSVQKYTKFLQDIASGKGYAEDNKESKSELFRARAKKATIEAAIIENTVLNTEDVRVVLNEAMVIMATQMDGLGGRLANTLADMDDPAAIRILLLNETRRIRRSAADRLSCLGDIADGSKNTAATTRPKRRSVGKSNKGAPPRKRRARAVSAGKKPVHDPVPSGDT